jgi:hypothetical protein
VTSKYDHYWTARLPEIQAQLRLAASGMPAMLTVPDLAPSGKRQSWAGVAEVRMREMTHSSGAHATSLGKIVAASGICADWPDRVFQFTIGSRGDVLTITAGRNPGEAGDNEPARIFMSYRREETAYPAAWLFERLASQFGRYQVFKDIDSIEPGEDFGEIITTAVESCHVLLALIGRQWLTIAGQDGRPRLENPDDFVRREIEAALARDVRVIPVLVDGARMPRAEDLPPSLGKLARRQALDLNPARFGADAQRLVRSLGPVIAQAQEQFALETDRVPGTSSPEARHANQGGRGAARLQPAPEPHHPYEVAAGDASGDRDSYERATWAAIEECKHLSHRYDPTIWIGMVRRSGAVEAAKQLLASGDIQYGFRRLIEEGRPDLTVEWSVLLPRWRQLFSDQYREAARWRLQQAGAKPPEDDADAGSSVPGRAGMTESPPDQPPAWPPQKAESAYPVIAQHFGRIVVYTGEPPVPEAFIGAWLVEPDEKGTRSGEDGADAGTYWGVALTRRDMFAVYAAHVNERWAASLRVYSSLDDAETDGVPRYILAIAAAGLGEERFLWRDI